LVDPSKGIFLRDPDGLSKMMLGLRRMMLVEFIRMTCIEP